MNFVSMKPTYNRFGLDQHDNMITKILKSLGTIMFYLLGKDLISQTGNG